MSSRREHVIARSSGMACILAVMLSSTGVAAEPTAVGEAMNRAANDVAAQVADWVG